MKSQKVQLSRWPLPGPDPERTTQQPMCPLTSVGVEQGLHVIESQILELWTDPVFNQPHRKQRIQALTLLKKSMYLIQV